MIVGFSETDTYSDAGMVFEVKIGHVPETIHFGRSWYLRLTRPMS